MNKFAKRDSSVVGQWWWTVDRQLLFAFFLLLVFGIWINFSVSPFIAKRIGFEKFYFIKRHLVMALLSFSLMLLISFLKEKGIKKFCEILFFISFIGLIFVLVLGHETKGAKRWLLIKGFSIQPSEFIKPALIILIANIFFKQCMETNFKGSLLALILSVATMILIFFQPDYGTLILIIGSCFVQFCLAGLPVKTIVLMISLFLVFSLFLFFFSPHFHNRIDIFLHPESDADTSYQIFQSLNAFKNGGLFGCGPGEGVVKKCVPDAHTDFIFSVVGEEYGLFGTLIIVLIFMFIIIRCFIKTKNSGIFMYYSVIGLSVQIAAQAFINMSTSLKIIPTKGMTMPFVSYGGSSMLAIGISFGLILALTRKRHGLVGDGI